VNIRPYFIKILLLFCLVLLSGCASNITQKSVFKAASATIEHQVRSKQKILVINSNQSVERYQIAESVFVQSMSDYHTKTINLETENQPTEYLQDILNNENYDLIYCIGAKALGSIDYIDPNLPVVYTAVLNWRRFYGRTNYYGIASELSPQVQLTWFKYFFPEVKNIGVFYGEENQTLIEDAKKTASNLSLKLKPMQLRNEQQLLLSAKTLLKNIEALWLISDSNTLSSIENVEQLFKLADHLNVPIFSYNPLFMDMGAVMSLVADLPTTARQAALLSMKLLGNTIPAQSIQFPAGSRIVLNGDNVRLYNLKLNPGALDSVDELQ
jgi:putative ABC transport system substrate-binding protein